MTIGEAKHLYIDKCNEYRDALNEISKRRTELEKKIRLNPNSKSEYDDEAAILELSYNSIKEKQEEYEKCRDSIYEQESFYANLKSTEQQVDAAKEYGKEMTRLMEVARRLIKGDIVPASDEKKLMDFNHELYVACKQMQAMAQEHEEDDTLWDDEEENEFEDPIEYADSQTAVIEDSAMQSSASEDAVSSVGSNFDITI